MRSVSKKLLLTSLLGAGAVAGYNLPDNNGLYGEQFYELLDQTRMIRTITCATVEEEIIDCTTSYGTTFPYNNDGRTFYVTAEHVTENDYEIEWDVEYNTRYSLVKYPSEIVGESLRLYATDEDNDLSLLTSEYYHSPLSAVSCTPNIGDISLAIGYYDGEEKIVDVDIVNSRLLEKNGLSYYHTGNDVIDGFSGGPVFTFKDGRWCIFGISVSTFGYVQAIVSSFTGVEKLIEEKK